MCGRLVQATAMQKIAGMMQILGQLELVPRYNITPSAPLAVIRSGPKGYEWALPRWGLVPHWAKEIATGYKMINAKAETVASKPAYRGPLRYRRCIIPADGFYEWRLEAKQKQPYFIRAPDEQPLLLAGLWDYWHQGEQELETCTIITTSANPQMLTVHDRMPVVLDPSDVAAWLDLDIQKPDLLEPLLQPTAHALTIYPVSKRVNKPVNDDAECTVPLAAGSAS